MVHNIIGKRLKLKDDIKIDLTLIEDGEAPSLGRASPQLQYSDVHLEITLNHPRTSKFVNMTSDEQRKLYDKMFSKMMQHLPEPLCETHITKVYEYCKSGHVHLHACVEYKLSKAHFPMGLIADTVKRWLNQIKQVYQEKNCFTEFNRYRSPSITCQYFQNNKERKAVWLEYMHKADYNKRV